MSNFSLIDSTLCRGQHCVWQGRMTTADVLPYLKRMDDFGFEAIDIMGPELFQTCVHDLGENPFERLRLAADRVSQTPLNVWTRGRFLFADEPLSEGVVAEGIKLVAASGAGRITCYDPLNDVESLRPTVEAASAIGLAVTGAVVYCLSPRHDKARFVGLANTLKDLGVASVCLFDPAGVLHPDAARELIPALVEMLGSTALELATHCRSGRAEICGLEAVAHGARTLHAVSPPLAGGPSLPSGAYFVEHSARDGIACATGSGDLAEMADYFGALAEAEGWPEAQHQLADQMADLHQMPLSRMGWLENALRDAGLEERRAEILDEIAIVREEAGHVPMSPPVAQLIARQALTNIAGDKRYGAMDPGFVRLVLGGFGSLPGPLDDALESRVSEESLGDEEPFGLGALRKLTPGETGDEAVMITACCGPRSLDGLEAGADAAAIPDIATPRDLLEAAFVRHPNVRRVRVAKGEFSYDWNASSAS